MIRLLQGQNIAPPGCYSSCSQHAHESLPCCMPLGAAQCLPFLPSHPQHTLLSPQHCATLLPGTKHLFLTMQEMFSSQPIHWELYLQIQPKRGSPRVLSPTSPIQQQALPHLAMPCSSWHLLLSPTGIVYHSNPCCRSPSVPSKCHP